MNEGMKNIRNILFYMVTIGGFSAIAYWILKSGEKLESGVLSEQVDLGSSWQQFLHSLQENVSYPVAILLLQVIIIILAARLCGMFFRKIGQPSVIGEIVAGILLGPSLVGTYLPDVSAFLFPASSLPNLGVMSQIGLILFMFVVGMELDLNVLKKQAHEAVVISHASIVFPFGLGIALAYFIYSNTAPAGVSFLSYSLFIGISMSITAFPVLARIVQERGMTKTRLGSIAITCAAADDITAWCLLAAVIAIVKAGSLASAGYTILFAAAYVLTMLRFVRPFLQRIGDLYATKERLSKPVVGVFFVTLLLSAWCTEVIGIHALFGAFMAGVIMPANASFRNIFIEKVEDLAQVLLLPLFFVFTGLRTEIGLLNEPGLWQLCAVIVLVAVSGKFLGSAIASRFVGQNWHSSLTIGALMNTRGLMELVALNIGYDLGVLTPELFAILVLMALVTTFMTGPALDMINKFFPEKEGLGETVGRVSTFNILISFANPQTGKLLLRVANLLVRKSTENSSVTALHLSIGNELNAYNSIEYERDSFSTLAAEGKKLGQKFLPVFQPSKNIDEVLTKTSNQGDYDLLLVGMGRSIFEGTLMGRILGFTSRVINPELFYERLKNREVKAVSDFFDDRTAHIIKTVKIPVGILVDRGMKNVEVLFVPIFSLTDAALFPYLQKFLHNSPIRINLLDAKNVIRQSVEFKEALRTLSLAAPGRFEILSFADQHEIQFETFDLMLVSVESWMRMVEEEESWLPKAPSALIVKTKNKNTTLLMN